MERIVIELDERTGNISFSFPRNKVLAYGLLHYALEAYRVKFIMPDLVPKIIPAFLEPPDGGRG